MVKKLQRQKKKNRNADATKALMTSNTGMTNQEECDRESEIQVVQTLAKAITKAYQISVKIAGYTATLE